MSDTDTRLIEKLRALPDFTTEITMGTAPSILLNSPQDRRIDLFAASRSEPFRVHGEGSSEFMVVVNPAKTSGFLWWKRAVRAVFWGDRWSRLLTGDTRFASDEIEFLQACH